MSESHKIGIVGLGRMGRPLCENLRDKGYAVVGYDKSESNRLLLSQLGILTAASIDEFCGILPSPRHIVLMVPAGDAVDDVISHLLFSLVPGDVIIDAGNSNYQDSIRRGTFLSQNGIGFLDVGISGGMSGARYGACLTIGGDKALYDQLEFFFKDIAQKDGYMYVGPSGWGHLVKTIHNGIEYGFLQAIAEGIHTLKAAADQKGDIVDFVKLCQVWGNGSIIASRLLTDTVQALKFLQDHQISGKIGGGETGQWALDIARLHNVSTPVLAASLAQRARSRQSQDFSGEIIAAIRNVFGGHEIS